MIISSRIDTESCSTGKWCVARFDQTLEVYNQTNTMIHYLAPFIVNVVCTITLVILLARNRANIETNKSLRQTIGEQIKRQKQIFIPPIITVISALPHIIISFSLACTELDRAWQRHLLTTTYFLSFIPQILTFHLYVQPSTMFMKEFYSTYVGKTLQQQFRRMRRRKSPTDS